MSRVVDVEFVLLVEAGALEAQAVLLVGSLRRFGGRHAAAAVTVVSPRPSRRPAPATIEALEQLGAEYLALDIDGACAVYPTSWRVHALAMLERRAGPDLLVQLDSDTVFLGDFALLGDGGAASARPVDVKGMGSAGPGDDFEPYWSALCALGGVGVDALPFVETTVNGLPIRATHNGGFVVAPRAAGLFARTDELFRLSVQADLRPHSGRGFEVIAGAGVVGAAGSEWWGSSQAATSVAAASLGFDIAPLDLRVNVPVHLWKRLERNPEPLLHAHYHGILAAGSSKPNPLLDGSAGLGDDVTAWLRARLPLAPAGPTPRHRAAPGVPASPQAGTSTAS